MRVLPATGSSPDNTLSAFRPVTSVVPETLAVHPTPDWLTWSSLRWLVSRLHAIRNLSSDSAGLHQKSDNARLLGVPGDNYYTGTWFARQKL